MSPLNQTVAGPGNGQTQNHRCIMDKYGVEQKVTKKTAAPSGTCSCGAEVQHHGPVTWCPRCGTEPWEDHDYEENEEDIEGQQD
jgi:hypothetical protein